MSRGFVKEYDDVRLDEIPPTMRALIRYLSMENGMPIHEVKTETNTSTGREVHNMSNGLNYTLDDDKTWSIAE